MLRNKVVDEGLQPGFAILLDESPYDISRHRFRPPIAHPEQLGTLLKGPLEPGPSC